MTLSHPAGSLKHRRNEALFAQAEVGHPDAAIQVFHHEPRLTRLAVAVRAQTPRPEIRKRQQSAEINLGLIRNVAAMSVGNMALPGLIFDEDADGDRKS